MGLFGQPVEQTENLTHFSPFSSRRCFGVELCGQSMNQTGLRWVSANTENLTHFSYARPPKAEQTENFILFSDTFGVGLCEQSMY